MLLYSLITFLEERVSADFAPESAYRNFVKFVPLLPNQLLFYLKNELLKFVSLLRGFDLSGWPIIRTSSSSAL